MQAHQAKGFLTNKASSVRQLAEDIVHTLYSQHVVGIPPTLWTYHMHAMFKAEEHSSI